jgi:hypothetical protein
MISVPQSITPDAAVSFDVSAASMKTLLVAVAGALALAWTSISMHPISPIGGHGVSAYQIAATDLSVSELGLQRVSWVRVDARMLSICRGALQEPVQVFAIQVLYPTPRRDRTTSAIRRSPIFRFDSHETPQWYGSLLAR